MNARTAARELALLTLFQLDKQGAQPEAAAPEDVRRQSLRSLVLNAVRALSAEAEDQIKSAADDLAAVSRMLLDYEHDHPSNLERPLDAIDQPVPIPTTRDMLEQIEKCLKGAEALFEAKRVPEMVALANQEDVRNYSVDLITLVQDNQAELDAMLDRHTAEDWRFARLNKMDQLILRLAAAEMKYVPSVDAGVSIDEAVEMAKQFSDEENYRFINGVLGSLAEELSSQTTTA